MSLKHKSMIAAGTAVAEERGAGMMGVWAVQAIPAGAYIYSFNGPLVTKPTTYTIQVEENAHVDCADESRFTNHSCDANAMLRYQDGVAQLIAVRDIARDEQVTFNYNTTEWKMASPFSCRCGTSNCAGLVAGMKHLDRAVQLELLPSVPAWMRARLLESCDV
jgi:hypothetical protein